MQETSLQEDKEEQFHQQGFLEVVVPPAAVVAEVLLLGVLRMEVIWLVEMVHQMPAVVIQQIST